MSLKERRECSKIANLLYCKSTLCAPWYCSFLQSQGPNAKQSLNFLPPLSHLQNAFPFHPLTPISSTTANRLTIFLHKIQNRLNPRRPQPTPRIRQIHPLLPRPKLLPKLSLTPEPQPAINGLIAPL